MRRLGPQLFFRAIAFGGSKSETGAVGQKSCVPFYQFESGLTGSTESGHAFARPGDREVVVALQVDPELRGGTQGLAEQPSGLRRYSALATNNFVDALHRNTDVLGKLNLRDS